LKRQLPEPGTRFEPATASGIEKAAGSLGSANTPGPAAAVAAAAIPLGTILLYNMASYAFNLYDTVLYAWLPYFYVPPEDSARTAFVSLSLFGIILAAGRVLDAVSDPLVGYWSDRTRSRWGRRKPYVVISGPLLFLSFLFVWRPPVNGISWVNALYLGALLFVYYWSYTGFLVPWLAAVPEMSRDNAVRVRIIAVGIAIGIFGSAVGGGLSGILIDRRGAFGMALILGFSAFLAGSLTPLGLKENYSPPEQSKAPRGFFRTVIEVFRDGQVLSFSGMILLVQLTYQLMLMNVPYMTTLILEESEGMASVLMGEVILLIALSTPLWYVLLKKYPKRRVMRWIIVLMSLGFFMSFFVGKLGFSTPFVQAMIIMPAAAIPMGGMFTASIGLIADLSDYGELRDGERSEAVYYGIYGIVRKVGWAFCSFILTATFARFGYSLANPFGVRVIWIICAVACLAGLLLFIPYRLGDSREETRDIMGL